MMKKSIINRNEINELKNNPTTRVPIVLCLDTSGSMSERNRNGARKIDELTNGIRMFYESVKADDLAAYAADVAIVTFADRAEIRQRFANVSGLISAPALKPQGVTAMGEGVNLALDLIEDRKEAYKSTGISYYQPWLVFMTDGYPYKGSQAELERAFMRCSSLVNKGRLTVIPVGIGERADMATVSKFSTRVPAQKLNDMKFADFFVWLSNSIVKVSQEQPCDDVKPDLTIRTWNTL